MILAGHSSVGINAYSGISYKHRHDWLEFSLLQLADKVLCSHQIETYLVFIIAPSTLNDSHAAMAQYSHWVVVHL